MIFEHQSTFDERMPFRFLRYQTRIWERHAAQHPDEPLLPPIVPLLLHHGPRPWPREPRFSSAIELDDIERVEFGANLVEFEFVLDDLSRHTDAQILSRTNDAVVRLTLLALRNGRSHSRLHELLGEAIRSLRE